MKQKLLFILALLCAIAHGAWADTWDGSLSKPVYYSDYKGVKDVVVIRKAAELAYANFHWDDDSGDGVGKDYYEHNMYLEADIDMKTDGTWKPMGGARYKGTFYGNNHTIRIWIDNSGISSNYQGLFETIAAEGTVKDLHVDGRVKVGNARMVGGIAGNSYGTIENCWVSADVESSHYDISTDADLGGIVGWNESGATLKYCCMTGNVTNTGGNAGVGGIAGTNKGTIQECTLYGTVTVNHSQANEFVGIQKGNLWDQHNNAALQNDVTLNNYLNSFSGNNLYRFAVKYPYSVNIANRGFGAVDFPVPGSRPGKTVRLTRTYGSTPERIFLSDDFGYSVYWNGNATDGYTFTMPKRNVNFQAFFSGTSWIESHSGQQNDPYLISSTADWEIFAYYVRQGYTFSGQYVKLTRDIDITTTVGLGEEFLYGTRPFSGTFLGEGHTLKADIRSTATGTDWNIQGVAPFHFIDGATIRNLTVAGTITSASYHTAGIVGFAFGTNLIEGCTVTATLNISSDYAGGIIGHGENSATTIRDCVFDGTINGTGAERANIGGIWGWSDSGTPVFSNCLVKGTFNNISSMHPIGLHGGSGSITNCYYLHAQTGTPALVSTVGGAYQVQASVPENEMYRQVTAADGKAYYQACAVTGVKQSYVLASSHVEPDVAVTWNGIALNEFIDYSVSYANNSSEGNASVTISGKGNYSGSKTIPFNITGGEVINTWWSLTVPDYHLSDGHTYLVKGPVDLDDDRVYIDGNVVLVLTEGCRLNCDYGIEVGEGKTLTIEGPGTLNVKRGSNDAAGIGAYHMGTLIINGGNINVTGGTYGAGIGGSKNNINGGRIVINGGVVNAHGGWGAAGIGGGFKGWSGNYGVCGDITINGGQVTAIAGEKSCSVGHGSYGSGGGQLTLGWTNPSDYFQCGNVEVGSVRFADGKQFVLDGTTTIATTGNINNKKIVPYVAVPALSGNGTAANPYTIGSADEWNRFAESVQYGNSYSGKHVKLTADISVNRKCGYVTATTPVKAFSGTFDGNGKTITATISDKHNQGTALFSYINGATIRNLTVAGTIMASQSHTAGLVGFADGTNLIEGCTVTATLNVSSDYAGGIIGHGLNSATTIKNSVFAGTINGVGGDRSNIGGIWGWSDSGAPTLENCLEKGTYTNIRSMHPMGLQNDKGTISQCFYLNETFGNPANACSVSGAYLVKTTAIDGEIFRQQRLVDGLSYYVPCLINNLDEFYELKDASVSITPTVTFLNGTPLSLGNDFTVTIDGADVTTLPLNVTTTGRHTLAISGKGNYAGTKNVTFTVVDKIVGDGSKDNPYLVNTVEHWSLFATLVNNGTDFSGLFVRLGNDITVTAMAGASRDKAFKGTFDGNGHTLTFNGGSASQPFGEDNCAPFRFVSDATIHDLKVAGNIYTFKKFAAGIVGLTSGKTAITGCQAGIVIHSSTAGDGTHGGLVALANDSLTIADCIFNGRLLTSNNTQYCGGFVGWHSSKAISITSSLYAPDTTIAGTTAESPINHGATFVRGDNAGAYCYYIEQMGDVQGKQVFTAQPDGELCVHAQAADGKTYYLPCTVSGIEAYFTLKDGSTSIAPVVTGVDSPLVLDTDYTATLNGNAVTSFPITITSKGSYTLALTGNTADCTGTKSITFDVYSQIMGEGTKANPYLIGDAADWNQLAINVANGQDYSGKYVKLTADISVSTMMGTRTANAFQGIFDGDGHTLTFTAGTPENPFDEEYCAPFRHAKNDTIRNLKVTGNIYSAKKFAAGLVSRTSGETTITGCQVSTVIHSTVNGDGTHGGLVAMPGGALSITDCIYDGLLLTTNGTTHCGGFVAWHNGQAVTVTSSLYAPDTNISAATGETPITVGATFVRGGSAGSYCFYTATMGEAQGMQVFATQPAGELCMQAQAADGKMYYLPCTVSGIEAAYYMEAGISITPTVTGLDNAALTFGTDYTVKLDGTDVTELPVSVSTEGEHTFTFTGKTADYTGTKSITFFAKASLKGEGTANNPYLISSTSDWALFAANVADSLSYSGQYVKLMADIDITLPVGVREDKPFCGIFDGNGHTITASISSTTTGTGVNEQGVAPFHYVKNVTIKNLTVGGTIASASYHTAGLVGFADGTNLIENCTVTATLNVSSNYAGGLVGHGQTSATTIRDCIFAGTINGVDGDRSNMGGIWGWSDSGTPVLENCMEKGTYTNISSMHPIGLQNNKGTLSHCYYLSPVIATPSHACTVSGAWQVYATDSGNDIYEKVKAVDSNSYFLPCTVSGVAKLYQHTGSDITILEPVITAADGTKLIAGTDFTYSPETVREKGDHTLTISGKGSYSGTKTMAFSVTDDMFVTSESTILSSGNYMVNENVTVNERINISGNVVLNLGEGTTLHAPKGIELSKGNALTINGPGKLLIDQAAREDAGIGAVEVGTLVINGGTIKVTCYGDAAAIGGSKDNVSGGSITINGGVVSLVSLTGPAIGGGRRTKEGHYGVCGDIVINGGQVDAVSLLYLAIGPGANTDDTSGTLKLGWTNPGDFVRISNTLNRKWQLESVTFAEGCAFVIQGTTTIATAENLRNNRIEPLLALADNSDNSTMLATRNGMQLPAALTGRTLYKDGKWNTICLPFDLTLSGSPLDGAVARPLTEASISGTTLNLTFGDTVTTLQAGTPYIIKWAKASDYVDDDAHNIISPVFSSVTIDATDRSYDNGQTGNDCVRFLGTYDAKSFTAADENSILLMGANNTLRYAGEGASLGACRAYFKIGVDGASQTRSITSFSIDFGDGEGETTGIVTVSKESEGKGASEGWYTLDGRRLPAKPTRAGVYINNGNKVVVK